MTTIQYAIIIIAILLILLIIVAFSLKKKPVEVEETGTETELEKSAKRALDSELRKGKMMFMALLITGISAMLGKLWDWWFTPKKVATTGGILLLAGGFFTFMTLTTVRGEFAVNIRTPLEIIPPENVEGITIVIEARIPIDSSNYKTISGIEFQGIDTEIEPFKDKATLSTNKDGIVYVKYNGRGFDAENLVFQVKVIATTADFDSKYYVDSANIKFSDYNNTIPVINLRKKRQMVYGTMPFVASIKSVEKLIKATEDPKKTFAIDVYPTNAEGKNTQTGRVFYKKDANSNDSTELEFRNGSFISQGLEFQNTPFLLTYTVEDSSKIAFKIVADEPKFKFDEAKPQAVTAGGGGSLPALVPTITIAEDSIPHQYSIKFVDHLGKELNNYDNDISIVINSSNSTFSENIKDRLDATGILKFPSAPIANLQKFWESAGSLTIRLYFNSYKGKQAKSLPFNFKPSDLRKTDILLQCNTVWGDRNYGKINEKQGN